MPTILLVDDSPLVLHALARRLEGEGFEVRTAATVAAGRAVDASSLACAAVDIDLPDGSGVALAVALRAARPGLPIAFFTAAGPTGEVAHARTYGPVFHKPDVDALVAWAKGCCQPPPTK
jgi:DNA-binding response OmpR family regulator